MKNYKIRTSEAIAIVTNLLCNKLFVLAPYYLQKSSGNAVLISISLFYIIAFITFNICIKFYHTEKDLFDMTKSNSMKLIIGTILSLVFFIVLTLTIRQYAEGVKILTMPKSPISFICGIWGIGMILGAYCGLKSIAKSNSIFTPIIFIIAILFVIFSAEGDNLYNVFPLFGEGLNSILKKGFIVLSMLFEIIVIYLLPTFLRKPKDITKIGNYSFLFSFIIFFIIGGAYCILKPQNFNLESYEPFFNLVKEIEFGNFMQRFDLLFFILYCLSGFLYLATMLNFLILTISKPLRLNDKKAIILPIGVLIVSTSFANNLQEYMFTFIGKINYFLWIVTFIMPFIPLIKFRRIK